MTTRTPKLSDLQLVLLSTACQRPDGSLLPPPDTIGDQDDRIRKSVTSLIRRGLAAEAEMYDAASQWRVKEGKITGVVITETARAIMAAENADQPRSDMENESEALDSSTPAADDRSVRQTQPSKIGLVLGLLRQEEGATIADITAATGWLPHTTRAALSGLRKKGHVITSAKADGGSRYHIGQAA